MESYLAGRGHTSGNGSSEDSGFRSYLNDGLKQVSVPVDVSDPQQDEQVEVVYDQADCPKVEVVSIEGKPRRIVIHLPDGKLLEISCEY
jgi:hypothetical protein